MQTHVKRKQKNNDIAKLALVSKGRVRTVYITIFHLGRVDLNHFFPKAALAYLVKVAFENFFFLIYAV